MQRFQTMQPEGQSRWAIWDAEKQEFVTGSNGQMRHFRTEDEAYKVLKYLNGAPVYAKPPPVRRPLDA